MSAPRSPRKGTRPGNVAGSGAVQERKGSSGEHLRGRPLPGAQGQAQRAPLALNPLLTNGRLDLDLYPGLVGVNDLVGGLEHGALEYSRDGLGVAFAALDEELVVYGGDDVCIIEILEAVVDERHGPLKHIRRGALARGVYGFVARGDLGA